MQAQAEAFRSGGQRRFGLPEWGSDPTDVAVACAALAARRREVVPERRLMVAVVMATLEDLRRYPVTTVQYARAWRWVMSDQDGWPFAFRPVCETLGLDAGAVRDRLRRTLARRMPEPVARGHRTYPVPRGRPPVLLCRVAS